MMLVSLLALGADAGAAQTELDLQAWLKERPRIRELVARWTQSDGKVNYLLLVADGSNYVVKIAPNEKLLRARVLTSEVDVAGRCGDEFWVARGKFPELRFVRERDLSSKETNYIGFTKILNYGVARLGLAFLRFGTEPLHQETDFRLTVDGFESTSGRLFKKVSIERVEHSGDGLGYELSVTTTGNDIGGGVSRYRVHGKLGPSGFIPLAYSVVDPDNSLIGTVERSSLKLSDSPIPLSHFKPEPYVLEGFHMVMQIRDGKVIAFPAGHPSWRKVMILGWVLPYRVVKWSVIALIAAITVVAAILVRKKQSKNR